MWLGKCLLVLFVLKENHSMPSEYFLSLFLLLSVRSWSRKKQTQASYSVAYKGFAKPILVMLNCLTPGLVMMLFDATPLLMSSNSE